MLLLLVPGFLQTFLPLQFCAPLGLFLVLSAYPPSASFVVFKAVAPKLAAGKEMVE